MRHEVRQNGIDIEFVTELRQHTIHPFGRHNPIKQLLIINRFRLQNERLLWIRRRAKPTVGSREGCTYDTKATRSCYQRAMQVRYTENDMTRTTVPEPKKKKKKKERNKLK